MTNIDIIKMINENKDILAKINENPTAEGIINIAKSKGFEITASEATEILDSLELPFSDDVLKQVAGGNSNSVGIGMSGSGTFVVN